MSKKYEEQSATSEVQSIEIPEPTKTVVGVGQYARALIKHAFEHKINLTNEQIAEKVVKKFAEHDVEVKTSAAAIAWYKNDMRKKGQLAGGMARAKSIVVNLENIAL